MTRVWSGKRTSGMKSRRIRFLACWEEQRGGAEIGPNSMEALEPKLSISGRGVRVAAWHTPLAAWEVGHPRNGGCVPEYPTTRIDRRSISEN